MKAGGRKVIFTPHAVKRWRERVNPEAGEDQAVEEMQKVFEQAVMVFEEVEEGGLVRYLVKDDILFVYDVTTNKVATVIDIDFGFSQEINRRLARMQTEYVLQLAKRIAENRAATEKRLAGLDNSISVSEGEIKSLEAKLEAVRATQRKLLQTKEELIKEQEALRKDYEAEFMRLKYSVNYRMETLKDKYA